MEPQHPLKCFSEEYGQWRTRALGVRESGSAVPEHAFQSVWHEQLFAADTLATEEGHRLRVLSPGWRNKQEGPDFKGAQILFNDRLFTGDVELHFSANAWKQHGHDKDPRYDNVVLHVVLHARGAKVSTLTSQGRSVPTLVLGAHLPEPLEFLAARLDKEGYDESALGGYGRCSQLIPRQGQAPVLEFIALAGEWRMLNKMRLMQERMEWVGGEQAFYEAVLHACGFSRFKENFRAIARHLPYDRARQLAKQDPLLLECAFLQIAGLLPESFAETSSYPPHFLRLHKLREEHLAGLRSLPLEWVRVGVRPNNSPERRLAGAARFFSRSAQKGLAATLGEMWLEKMKPRERRIAFEGMFPSTLGFWATHCTWTGKRLPRPSAPLGAGRVRSIIGNVFIPAGLALARQRQDRTMEEAVLDFFKSLPQEPGNHVVAQMIPRLFADHAAPRLNFCLQQGMLQMHMDWCQPNPSCRNCTVYSMLEHKGAGNQYGHEQQG